MYLQTIKSKDNTNKGPFSAEYIQDFLAKMYTVHGRCVCTYIQNHSTYVPYH